MMSATKESTQEETHTCACVLEVCWLLFQKGCHGLGSGLCSLITGMLIAGEPSMVQVGKLAMHAGWKRRRTAHSNRRFDSTAHSAA